MSVVILIFMVACFFFLHFRFHFNFLGFCFCFVFLWLVFLGCCKIVCIKFLHHCCALQRRCFATRLLRQLVSGSLRPTFDSSASITLLYFFFGFGAACFLFGRDFGFFFGLDCFFLHKACIIRLFFLCADIKNVICFIDSLILFDFLLANRKKINIIEKLVAVFFIKTSATMVFLEQKASCKLQAKLVWCLKACGSLRRKLS